MGYDPPKDCDTDPNCVRRDELHPTQIANRPQDFLLDAKPPYYRELDKKGE